VHTQSSCCWQVPACPAILGLHGFKTTHLLHRGQRQPIGPPTAQYSYSTVQRQGSYAHIQSLTAEAHTHHRLKKPDCTICALHRTVTLSYAATRHALMPLLRNKEPVCSCTGRKQHIAVQQCVTDEGSTSQHGSTAGGSTTLRMPHAACCAG
jgi:hypothetical protein